MYDEYRIIKVIAKITPTFFDNTVMSANTGPVLGFSWDRNGAY